MCFPPFGGQCVHPYFDSIAPYMLAVLCSYFGSVAPLFWQCCAPMLAVLVPLFSPFWVTPESRDHKQLQSVQEHLTNYADCI